jgi:predicted dehydrogenase
MALRVGLIGSGFMAGIHAGALGKIEDVEVCAVTSLTKELAADFIRDKNLKARAYGDFAAMLDTERLEAVYVCIPPSAHADEVAMAADRGIHLFLEKPIAIGSAAAQAMTEAIERNRVKSQVGFHLRFRKAVRELKARIDVGDAGRPTLFTGRYWTRMEGSAWWRDRERSGGQVFEQVIHLYDLATHLFGPVAAASGMIDNLCHRDRPDYTIEDTSIGMLRFANGAMGVITGSNCAVPMHFFGDFRAVCAKATLDYRCTGQNWVHPDTAILYSGETVQDEFVEDEDCYLQESLDFMAAIREDREALTPVRDGLAAIRLVEAVMAGKALPDSRGAEPQGHKG